MAKIPDFDKSIDELESIQKSLNNLMSNLSKKGIDEEKLSNIMANEIVAFSFQYTPYDFARDLSYGEATEQYRQLDNRLRTGKYQRMHSNEITNKIAKGKYTFGTKNKDIRYKKPIGLKRTILKNSLLSMRKDGTKDSMVYISKNKSLLSKLIRSKSQLRKYSSLSNAEKKRNSAILNKQLEKKAISDLAGLTKEHLRNTVFVSGNTIGYTAPYAEKLYYGTGYKFQQANGRKQAGSKIGALWLDKTWKNHKDEISNLLKECYKAKVTNKVNNELKKISDSPRETVSSSIRTYDKQDFVNYVINKYSKKSTNYELVAYDINSPQSKWDDQTKKLLKDYLKSRKG